MPRAYRNGINRRQHCHEDLDSPVRSQRDRWMEIERLLRRERTRSRELANLAVHYLSEPYRSQALQIAHDEKKWLEVLEEAYAALEKAVAERFDWVRPVARRKFPHETKPSPVEV